MVLKALRGWTATQRNVVIAAYLGWTLDAFDFLMLTLVTKDIAEEFNVKATALGLVITATLALRPVGAFIFGRLADRFGRRPILMLNVLTYSLLAFASAFAPDFTTFLILRCLFGVAMGGEWGVGSSLAMEHARPESRGFVSGLLQTGYPTGGLIAAGAAALFLEDHGWRFLVMLSVIPALLVVFIRMGVPESPAWKSGASGKSMAIKPTAQRGGIGQELLETLEEFAREAGFSKLYLYTTFVLPGAKRLYEKNGFYVLRETPPEEWYDMGGLEMEKILE